MATRITQSNTLSYSFDSAYAACWITGSMIHFVFSNTEDRDGRRFTDEIQIQIPQNVARRLLDGLQDEINKLDKLENSGNSG